MLILTLYSGKKQIKSNLAQKTKKPNFPGRPLMEQLVEKKYMKLNSEKHISKIVQINGRDTFNIFQMSHLQLPTLEFKISSTVNANKVGNFSQDQFNLTLSEIQNKKALSLDRTPPEVWKTKAFNGTILSLCNKVYND